MQKNNLIKKELNNKINELKNKINNIDNKNKQIVNNINNKQKELNILIKKEENIKLETETK